MEAVEQRFKAPVTWGEVLFAACVMSILTASIAAPNFQKSRGGSPRHKACVANLKQIAAAKDEYAEKYRLSAGATLPDGCLWAKDGFIRSQPECPTGGDYTVGIIGETPRCTLGGTHSLE